jgi:hypothetical protein
MNGDTEGRWGCTERLAPCEQHRLGSSASQTKLRLKPLQRNLPRSFLQDFPKEEVWVVEKNGERKIFSLADPILKI